MESRREILTFQIGHYSNFVGTHWWNLNEAAFLHSKSSSDIDHDVLYREGWSTYQKQVTFTPRLVAVDLKGSLKHVRVDGDLYEDLPIPDVNSAPWPTEKVQVNFTDQPVDKNVLQKHLEKNNAPADTDYKLEDHVTVWSDFLVPRLHPRSVIVSNDYEHKSEHHPFDIYQYGCSVWNNSDFQEDMAERIRMYMEECNNAQGFQLLSDGTDGFGGISTGLLEYLLDEYHNKSILAIPLLPPVDDSISPLQEYIRNLNFSLVLQKMSELASLVVPLSTNSEAWRTTGSPRSFSDVSYNPKLPYHTSAILAAAIDTFSIQYRLRDGSDRLSDMVNTMSWRGRKVASCSVGLPFGIKEQEYLFQMLENWEGPLCTSLTPHCDPDIEDVSSRTWMQSVVLRGVPNSRLRLPAKLPGNPATTTSLESAAGILQAYMNFSSHGTCSHVFSSEEPCYTTPPFPSIFKPTVGLNGDILLHGGRHEKICVRHVPMMSSISSCEAIGSMLETLIKETARLPLSRFPAFSKAGLEADDYKEVRHQLMALAENYDENEI